MSTVGGVLVAGRYRLIGEIGRGPHGRVWRANDELLNREIAVKELVDIVDREQVMAAIRAASVAMHPSIVEVYHVVSDLERVWVAQRLVRGHCLADLVAQTGPLSVPQAERLAGQVLAALRAAHQAGVVHRDVKPSNVIVDSDGVAVLTDFSLAAGPEAQANTLADSPRYPPPERIISNKVGPEGDLFQAGATLYFALSAREPFGIDHADAVRSAYDIAMQPHAALDQGIELATLVDGLLDKDAQHRLSIGAAQVMLAGIGSTPLPSNVRVVLDAEAEPAIEVLPEPAEEPPAIGHPSVDVAPSQQPRSAGPPASEALYLVESTVFRSTAPPQSPASHTQDGDQYMWGVEELPTEWNAWTTERELVGHDERPQRAPRRPDIDSATAELDVFRPGRPPPGPVGLGQGGNDLPRRRRRGLGPLLGWLAVAVVILAATGVGIVMLQRQSAPAAVTAVPTLTPARALPSQTQSAGAPLTARTLVGHASWVGAVAWSPDGRLVASASADKSIRVWNPANGLTMLFLDGHTAFVDAVAWSADGNVIASGGGDNTVRIWDAHSGKLMRTLTGHTAAVKAVALSPDGRLVASAGVDHSIRLWDVSSGALVRQLAEHTERVMSVGWSPDGATLASVGDDAVLRLWNPFTGALVHASAKQDTPIRALAWAPNSTALATAGDDGTVRVWNPATATVLRELAGPTGQIWAVAWSPAGGLLASAGEDGTVRLWDARTGAAGKQLTGHTSAVTSVAFSPDGASLASGGNDRDVRIWVVN